MTYVISDIHGDYDRYMKMLDLIKLDEDRDVLSFASVIDYRFEADGEKVLILNPVPKKVLRKFQNTTREVDNGDRIGGYLVYTGNAFLRGLQADSIGKVDRKDPYKWI